MDEGGWGGEWGVIAAAAETTTKTKAGKKSRNQHQAQTHNNTKKETKSTAFDNERRKNSDNSWGTNADGWGGGWADEAPAAPVASDNDPNTVADDNICWDNSDNPWAQTDNTQGIKISQSRSQPCLNISFQYQSR